MKLRTIRQLMDHLETARQILGTDEAEIILWDEEQATSMFTHDVNGSTEEGRMGFDPAEMGYPATIHLANYDNPPKFCDPPQCMGETDSENRPTCDGPDSRLCEFVQCRFSALRNDGTAMINGNLKQAQTATHHVLLEKAIYRDILITLEIAWDHGSPWLLKSVEDFLMVAWEDQTIHLLEVRDECDALLL